MSVEKTCSFYVILNEHCGPNRGEGKIIFLRECGNEISNHLRRCHLSCENVTEIDLILARAGLFDLSASKVKQMTVCPKHRNNLGRYWQSPRTCQYPEHTGRFNKSEEGIVINLKTSKEIYTLFGETAQVGSRKYKIFYLLLNVLLIIKTWKRTTVVIWLAKYSSSLHTVLFTLFFFWLAICTTCRKRHKEKLEGAKWLQSFSKDEPPISESCNRYYISMVKSHIYQQKTFLACTFCFPISDHVMLL